MAWSDRLVGFAEERLGVAVVPRERLDRLQESMTQLAQFKEEASELAWWSLDYFNGRPQEMRAERRKRLAQRSRVALMHDPLAGAEANLRADFALGRGAGRPIAKNEAVQKVIDRGWDDPVNKAKLTGFEAQRHRSNDLLTSANLFPTAFITNGRVRLAFLDADLVEDIVTDPDDDERPLYYVAHKRRQEWDYEQDRPKLDTSGELTQGQPKRWYYRHWRNVEDAERERAENGESRLDGPPDAKTAEGVVEHFRINRVGRTQFGIPPWARSLRFFTAMNALTEAHVAMAQARASFIAKRTVNGSPNQIVQSANSILAQTGEIAGRFGESLSGLEARTEGAAAPPDPASIWLENKEDTLTSLNLSSGASEAQQTAQVVRAPIAAAGGFGQHYFGDASNANLATATSLELPALMNIGGWQETFEQLFRWFTDLLIETAVRNGELGGFKPDVIEEAESAWYRARQTDELRIQEDRAEMERRTEKKLDYSFQMPYPGRRNLPDVASLVTTVASEYDKAGDNEPLREGLLEFLAVHALELEDPKAWVEEVIKAAKKSREDAAKAALELSQMPGSYQVSPDGTVQPGGTGQPSDQQPQDGAKTRGTPPSNGDMGTVSAGLLLEVEELYRDHVAEPLGAALVGANGGAPGA